MCRTGARSVSRGADRPATALSGNPLAVPPGATVAVGSVDDRGRRRILRRSIALLALFLLTACGETDDKVLPGKVCRIAPSDGEVAIMAAIDRCPDGSTVLFPPGRTYRQTNRILVEDRHNLTIDGNGSSFNTSSTSTSVNGNWVILRGTQITLQNMTSAGTFDLQPPYSLAKYPQGVGWESNSAYAFYGTDGGGVRDATAINVWGDGVITAFDGILDPSVPQAEWQVARNLVIERITVDNASRVCLAPTQTINNVFRDSVLRNCWTWGVDAEADAEADGNLHNALPIDGLDLLNNTFEGYNYGAIAVPVGGDADTTVGNIEIRGNRLLTGPTQAPCQSSILIGVATYSNRIRNVVVEDNEITAMANAVDFNHVDGGVIRNNRFVYTDYGLAGAQQSQCDPGRQKMVRVNDSTGVVHSNE